MTDTVQQNNITKLDVFFKILKIGAIFLLCFLIIVNIFLMGQIQDILNHMLSFDFVTDKTKTKAFWFAFFLSTIATFYVFQSIYSKKHRGIVRLVSVLLIITSFLFSFFSDFFTRDTRLVDEKDSQYICFDSPDSGAYTQKSKVCKYTKAEGLLITKDNMYSAYAISHSLTPFLLNGNKLKTVSDYLGISDGLSENAKPKYFVSKKLDVKGMYKFYDKAGVGTNHTPDYPDLLVPATLMHVDNNIKILRLEEERSAREARIREKEAERDKILRESLAAKKAKAESDREKASAEKAIAILRAEELKSRNIKQRFEALERLYVLRGQNTFIQASDEEKLDFIFYFIDRNEYVPDKFTFNIGLNGNRVKNGIIKIVPRDCFGDKVQIELENMYYGVPICSKKEWIVKAGEIYKIHNNSGHVLISSNIKE